MKRRTSPGACNRLAEQRAGSHVFARTDHAGASLRRLFSARAKHARRERRILLQKDDMVYPRPVIDLDAGARSAGQVVWASLAKGICYGTCADIARRATPVQITFLRSAWRLRDRPSSSPQSKNRPRRALPISYRRPCWDRAAMRCCRLRRECGTPRRLGRRHGAFGDPKFQWNQMAHTAFRQRAQRNGYQTTERRGRRSMENFK